MRRVHRRGRTGRIYFAASVVSGPHPAGAGPAARPLEWQPVRMEIGIAQSGGSGASPPGDATLLDTLDAAVLFLDRNGRLRRLNAAWTRLTGFEAAQSLQRPHGDFIHPADRVLAARLMEAHRPAGPGRPVRYLHRDGRVLHMELRAATAPDGESLVLLLTDCSARVRNEELRLASHRTLQALISQLPGMVYRCRNNPSWTMEFVSAGALALTGYAAPELVNNNRVAYADLILPADRPRVWDEVQRALGAQRPFELVYRIIAASGEQKWVLERGRGNFTSEDELLGLEGFITDITAERQAEMRREQGLRCDSSGLASEPLLLDRVRQALHRARRQPACAFALVHLRLDRFGRLSARLGPEATERLLDRVAERLLGALQPGDSLCRGRPGEFLILLEALASASPDHCRALAHGLARPLQAPFDTPAGDLLLSASLGLAVGQPGWRDEQVLLEAAAGAMQRARAAGGDRCQLAPGPAA